MSIYEPDTEDANAATSSDSTAEAPYGADLRTAQRAEPDNTDSSPDESDERTFTKAEVEAIVKKRHRQWRRQEAKKSQRQEAAEPEPAATPDAPSIQDRLDRSDRSAELFRCMIDSSVSSKHRKALEKLVEVDKPELADMGEWLAETCELFGFTEQHREPATATPEPPEKSASDYGAPAAESVDPHSRTFDYVRATKDDYERIKAAMGPQKYKAWLKELNAKIQRGEGAVSLELPKRRR